MEQNILKQIAIIEQQFQELSRKTQYDDFSGDSIQPQEVTRFNASCLVLIERATGRESSYHTQAVEVINKNLSYNGNIPKLYGIVCAVKNDIENGYLQTARELIHAELFSDFIEMADYLLGEGYKDASAVLLGGVLEGHLRKLAENQDVSLTEIVKGVPKPKRAEKLNEDLRKISYSLLEQKTVTAWLDLRNKAAHGNYDEYDESQVSSFSQGLKDFILRHPA